MNPSRRRHRTLLPDALEDRTHLDAAFGWAFGVGSVLSANSRLQAGYVSSTTTTVRTDGTYVYLSGVFSEGADFDPSASYPDNHDILTEPVGDPPYGHAFLAKYDTSGHFIWARDTGIQAEQNSAWMERDAAGDFYLVGRYNAPANLGNGVSLAWDGSGPDTYLAKFSPSGVALWARRFYSTNSGGSQYYPFAKGVALDAAGNVYTTGSFGGTLQFDANPGTKKGTSVASAGGNDVFITKHDPAGNLIWTKRIGGRYEESGGRIAADGAGNVVVGGWFRGTVDFDPSTGTDNLTSTGDPTSSSGSDTFVLKLDTNGNFRWADRLGGPGNDGATSLVLDGAGHVLVAGVFSGGPNDFDPGPGVANLPQPGPGSADVYLVKLDANGGDIWARALGDAGPNTNGGLALDASGNIYLSGQGGGGSGDYDPGPGVAQLPGGATGYILKLDSAGNFGWLEGLAAIDPGSWAYSGGGKDAIAVDAAGDVYVGGGFLGRDDFDPGASVFPLTSGANPPGSASDLENAFLLEVTQHASSAQGSAPSSAPAQQPTPAPTRRMPAPALSSWRVSAAGAARMGPADVGIAVLGGAPLDDASGSTATPDPIAAGPSWSIRHPAGRGRPTISDRAI